MPIDAQLAHRVLGRLGLQLLGGGDVGHQREVDVDRVVAPELEAELADRLEERQRLDVADRAADLDDHHVDALRRRGCIASLISSVMCGMTWTVLPR